MYAGVPITVWLTVSGPFETDVFGKDELDRHRPTQLDVRRLYDDAHSTLTEHAVGTVFSRDHRTNLHHLVIGHEPLDDAAICGMDDRAVMTTASTTIARLQMAANLSCAGPASLESLTRYQQ
jgi:hypothetical protein